PPDGRDDRGGLRASAPRWLHRLPEQGIRAAARCIRNQGGRRRRAGPPAGPLPCPSARRRGAIGEDMTEEIIFEVDGAIATITLNRPAKLNAVTPEMADAI